MSLTLYSWPTPNSYKISILLAELGIDYKVKEINIIKGDQFDESFLKISPNNKMPALVDTDGPDGQEITLFESGAIMLYLAKKFNKFYPSDERSYYEMLQWLMFQMAGFGPMLGQAHHFRQYAPEEVPYGIERYTNEANRLYRVLERRLSTSPYVSGDEYGLADMAIYPWTRSFEKQGVDMDKLPHVKKWFETISARAAVQEGLKLQEEASAPLNLTEEERETLFGNKR